MALKLMSFIFIITLTFGIDASNQVKDVRFNTNEVIKKGNPYSNQNEFLIDTNIVYSPAPYDQRLSSVAFDGTNYLIVWQDSRNIYDSDIYGARVSQTGVVLDSAGIPISTNLYNQSAPSVAFDGNNFLVVWTDDRNVNTLDIYGARLNQDGFVLDPVGIPISTYFDDQFDPAVAFDGLNYLVVWTDYRGPSYDIYGTRVTQSGIVLDSNGFLITFSHENQESPSITFGDTNYLVVWLDDRMGTPDIYGARINRTGIVLDSGGIFISSYGEEENFPLVAFDGNNFLVVWEDARSGTDIYIYGARVDQNGVLLDPTGIRISPIGYSQHNPAISFDGINYLVSWEDSRGVYGARVTQSGIILDTAGIFVSPSGYDVFPSVTFNGTNYLVAWSERRSGSSYDILGVRMNQAGIVLDTTSIILSTGTYWQQSSSIAFDGNNYLVVWEDGRNNYSSDIFGTRVSQNGQVLDLNGIAISSTGGSLPSVAFDGTNYLVVWSGVYGARVNQAGIVLDSNAITISNTGGSSPSVAFDGTNYLVVWSGVYGARVSQDGIVLDSNGIAISSARGSSPSVAFDGNNYLVVWQEWHSGSWDDIYGAIVDQNGIVLDSITISTALRWQESPSVAFDGTNYLVVWQDWRYYPELSIFGARVNQDDSVLDPNGFAISTATGEQRCPSIFFDGTDYWVVWQDGRNSDWDIYGAKIDTSGMVIDTFAVSIQNGYQFSPALIKGSESQVLITYSGWTDSINHRPVNIYRIWGKFYQFVGMEQERPMLEATRLTLEAYPNPFSKQTAIRFTPDPSGNKLKIFDISGKLVKSFAPDHQQLRTNNYLVWDGKDDTGQELPAGVYMLHLKTTEGTYETKEIIILR